ncbi:hypothetical protein EB796_012229 [Bugula neritina]|uniref:Uncharacterized protein n=1 Tax=Bugula neritina TaxID=10212 RepID=A0A7J7JVT9_BUGNE|nr:hypothetical protein EB796_012229 [Bugula neritina]
MIVFMDAKNVRKQNGAPTDFFGRAVSKNCKTLGPEALEAQETQRFCTQISGISTRRDFLMLLGRKF